MLFTQGFIPLMTDSPSIFINMYRKPTHPDHSIKYHSNHPISHKLAFLNSVFHKIFSISLSRFDRNSFSFTDWVQQWPHLLSSMRIRIIYLKIMLLHSGLFYRLDTTATPYLLSPMHIKRNFRIDLKNYATSLRSLVEWNISTVLFILF